MLKLLNICKEYTAENVHTRALKDISLEFRKSEFVAILGPSGCGKTTLLNIIGGLDRYTSGKLFINGTSTEYFQDCDWDNYRNHKIGFVFQTYNLIMHQRVGANVELALTISGMDKAEKKLLVQEALTRVGLGNQARKKPNQLSGGQMQRVAIARAFVSKPEIILADEPTGALDSESSVQIMDILKEISEEKLVIMVTHNPELAEKYATRIIRVSDGEVISDSNPPAEGEIPFEVEEQPTKPLTKTQRRKLRRANDEKRRKNYKRGAMSLNSTSKLSFNNLMTKKGRTILTTIAGSIGIIGISIVLALSAGFSDYIYQTEENALSQYPITVQESDGSITAVLDLLMKKDDTKQAYPNEDTVYVGKVLGNVLENFSHIFSKNDLPSVKKYLDENFDENDGFIKYGYGTQMNIYSDYFDKGNYTKINPFNDRIASVMDAFPQFASMMDNVVNMASNLSSWDELVDNPTLLQSQYELLGKSRWPAEKDELILVVDSYNQIDDYMLFALGLRSPDDIASALNGKSNFSDETFSVNELIGTEYKLLRSCDYYQPDSENGWKVYDQKTDGEEINGLIAEKGMTLKVVGIVRPKEGVEGLCINGVGAYSKALSDYIATTSMESDIVKTQTEAWESGNKINVITGDEINENLYNALLERYGKIDLSNPKVIYIYAQTFESKDNIVALLESYKTDTGKELKYTDTLALLMNSVTQILDAATGVLTGFSAISLIVSSIMIAIITYTSVMERTKEIGVLRSMGARKKDIANLFSSETAMIGFASGCLGVIITLLISIPVNIMLKKLLGIAHIMNVVWWHALCMVALSVLLSLIAGLIPSQIAAKKDPVLALRSGE